MVLDHQHGTVGQAVEPYVDPFGGRVAANVRQRLPRGPVHAQARLGAQLARLAPELDRDRQPARLLGRSRERVDPLERTREIGLLRAVGMKRRQVRAMIRSESVIVALIGGVVGIVRGTVAGVALAFAMRNNGVTKVSVPVVSLIVSAALGLAAATWPARRAANLEVLAAIATE